MECYVGAWTTVLVTTRQFFMTIQLGSKADVMKCKDVMHEVATRSGLSKTQAEAAVVAFLDTVQESVTDGRKVSFSDFGYWEPRERQARTGRNPQTGEPIRIPSSRYPTFSAGRTFKDRVKST